VLTSAFTTVHNKYLPNALGYAIVAFPTQSQVLADVHVSEHIPFEQMFCNADAMQSVMRVQVAWRPNYENVSEVSEG